MVYPRPVVDLDRAIALITRRRRERRDVRDRRERDMLDALRDVERYERQIAADTSTIEDLFLERECSTHPERFAPDTRIAPTP